MTNKKNALGKGLVALIRDAGGNLPASGQPPSNIQSLKPNTLPIGLLRAGRFQPRKLFDEESLKELARSIQATGVLQPLLVRLVEEGGESIYEIVAGERRFRAAQKAGLTSVPVLIRPTTDKEALQIGLIENLQRKELNPIEEARGFQNLTEQFDYSHSEVAEMVGKSRSFVANAVRLLSLPSKVQDYLTQGKLTYTQGRALLALPNSEAIVDEVVAQGLTVRAIENLAGGERRQNQTSQSAKGARKGEQVLTADDKALLHRLSQKIGLQVQLERKQKGGNLTIAFQSDRQIEQVINKLLND